MRCLPLPSHKKQMRILIQDFMTCDTQFAIYVLECNICKIQYVGMTVRNIEERMRHRGKFASHSSALRPLAYM